MKLALDHHYSPVIAVNLRELGHDAIAAIERGWEAEEDEYLLNACEQEQRAMMTNNVGDFMAILRRGAAEGRAHAGLIFTSDASMPRHRATIGLYVTILDALLRSNAGADAFRDRVHWL